MHSTNFDCLPPPPPPASCVAPAPCASAHALTRRPGPSLCACACPDHLPGPSLCLRLSCLQAIPPLPKRRGRPPASAGDGAFLGEGDPWGAAGATPARSGDSSYSQQYSQQQQQQQPRPPPDPQRLAALAAREQQLGALQTVRMELEGFRLLSDQVRRREKLKSQVWAGFVVCGRLAPGCCCCCLCTPVYFWLLCDGRRAEGCSKAGGTGARVWCRSGRVSRQCLPST